MTLSWTMPLSSIIPDISKVAGEEIEAGSEHAKKAGNTASSSAIAEKIT